MTNKTSSNPSKLEKLGANIYPLLALVSTVALAIIANSSLKNAAVAKLKATCIAHHAAPLLKAGWDVDAAVASAVSKC
ncbi:MAG: hypothetical protein VKI39_07690 [Synechococcus sp.]|nr:hypothetical protein [Synechococcus sp.]